MNLRTIYYAYIIFIKAMHRINLL